MKKQMSIGGLVVAAQILGIPGAFAGPWEDGMAAYNRGDYLPAIRLFRPLAEQGNPKAQSVLGVMYRKGQGVARNSMRAFVWFSFAAARGDARAKAGLRKVSRTMTRQEVSQAREMAQACEASDYRSCEY
jgi:TPR repeat protein